MNDDIENVKEIKEWLINTYFNAGNAELDEEAVRNTSYNFGVEFSEEDIKELIREHNAKVKTRLGNKEIRLSSYIDALIQLKDKLAKDKLNIDNDPIVKVFGDRLVLSKKNNMILSEYVLMLPENKYVELSDSSLKLFILANRFKKD